MRFTFPNNFKFGVASSATQIESASYADGKGMDIWQKMYAEAPEKFDYHDTDFGSDFYHKYKDDVKLLAELGVNSFRFSIAWARIYPDGPDEVNQAGIDYYNDLLNELTKHGIAPLFDLWHSDLPAWVIEKGDTVNPEFIDWFVTYAKTCFEAFGDRVAYWSTVNEPQGSIMARYAWVGEKNIKKANLAAHHMILAHFKTVKLYREMGFKGKIGMVNHFQLAYGASTKEEDIRAAERDMAFYTFWYTDPVYLGHYPEEVMDYPYMRDNMPENYQRDLDENFVKSDFIGMNYYGSYPIQYAKNDVLDYEIAPFHKADELGYYEYPAGTFDVVKLAADRYPGYEIVMTENGHGVKKWGNYEEELFDEYRINCIREHLRCISRCIWAGLPITGYYHWTFIDTFEGPGGAYNCIFALVQVRFDKENRERIPRKSFYYYKDVISKRYVE